MARQAKLRKKKVGKSTYEFTKAGGDTYFGNVEVVGECLLGGLVGDLLLKISQDGPGSKRSNLSAGEMMDLFLDWVQKYRAPKSYETRQNDFSRFGSLVAGQGKTRLRDLPADKVCGDDPASP